MRPYRQPGAEPPPPDKTPVVLTYGPFTLRKNELGRWTLDVPESFGSEDISRLGRLVGWAQETAMTHEMRFEAGDVLGPSRFP